MSEANLGRVALAGFMVLVVAAVAVALLTGGALDGPETVVLLLLAAVGIGGIVAARAAHGRRRP